MEAGMEAETCERIKEALLAILKSSDRNDTSVCKVCDLAVDRLGLDLSLPDRQGIVGEIIESFLLSDAASVSAAAPMEMPKSPEKHIFERVRKPRLLLCNLSNKRKVTIQDFRGKKLVSIREYYEKDGKQLPSTKEHIDKKIKRF